MVFSSTVFLFLFLPATLILYYLPLFLHDARKRRKYRNLMLTVCSLGFYAWGEPVFIFVLLASVLLHYLLVRRMEKCSAQAAKKRCLTVAIGFDILLLFVFKYLTFALNNLGLLLHTGGSGLDIALPIGISFFTFQIMSYAFDVYYGRAGAQKSFLNLTLYLMMFPQLIAGPIVRYETVAVAIADRKETLSCFSSGMQRFCVGLAKKTLLANYVALIADNMFARLGAGLSTTSAWLGAIAYMLQIYFDFSGYSDMAIGLGAMFGFRFDENFNYPYAAASITDFWRRWHISLSTWFRDYVYIPLGGGRNGRGAQLRNLLIVWLLTGIWHGANWTFFVWGLYYFALLAAEKALGLDKRKNAFTHLYTLFFVLVGWVLFRAESLADASAYLAVMFGRGAFTDAVFTYYLSGGKWPLLIGVLACLPVVPWLRKRSLLPEPVCLAFTLVLFALSVVVCVKSTYNPFIYFNF